MTSKYLWLLDPGHGGIINGEYQTAGKRSPKFEDGRQLFEGEFNRDIVKRILKLCAEGGIEAYNLVDTEIDVPLRERTDLANDIFRKNYQENGKKSVFLSVHANAWTKDGKFEFNSANGWEVFTTPGETKSDKVATLFFNEMKATFPNEKFRADHSDSDPDKEAMFFVLRKTVMPAILTENFFMTNRENCEIILSEEGRKKIAEAHFKAMKKVEALEL